MKHVAPATMLILAAACGEDHLPPANPTASGTGGGAEGGGGAATAEGGGGSSSSGGGGAAPECGNGEAEPGELCFDMPYETYPWESVGGALDLVAVDCDEDGVADVATVLSIVGDNGSSVATFRNDGVGAFTSVNAVISPGNTAPLALALGPFPPGADVVVALDANFSASYTFGGSCTVTSRGAKGSPPSGYTFVDVAAGDIDDDGSLDVLWAGSDLSGNRTVSWYDDAGTQTDHGLQSASSVTAVATGDIDADGFDDVAVADPVAARVRLKSAGGGSLSGSFFESDSISVPGGPRELALGDLDGDAFEEIVTVNENDTVSVLLNDGDGSFALQTPDVAIGDGVVDAADPWKVALADMDNDGDLDVVTANADDSGGTSSVSVLLNDGDGALTLAAASPLVAVGFPQEVGRQPKGLAVADFNDDGALDIATSGAYLDGGSVQLTVLLQSP